jgi:hypothetical protein
MKKGILFSLFVLGIQIAIAQNKTATGTDYKTAIGVKIWDGAGLSLKTFISEKI